MSRGYWNRPDATEAAIAARRLVPQRRHRPPRRRRVPLPRRPGQGHDHPRRRERVLRRDRARPRSSTPTCSTPRSSACRTASSARRSRRSCSCAPARPTTADDLRAHCAEHLAEFKVPEYVELRDEPLPRNPAGQDPQERAARRRRRLRVRAVHRRRLRALSRPPDARPSSTSTRRWGYVASSLNGLAGLYALAAWRWKRLRGRPVWIATIVGRVGDPRCRCCSARSSSPATRTYRKVVPRFHMFYGFLIFVTIGLLYQYRQPDEGPAWSCSTVSAGLFIMGLGIRAILQVTS